MNAANQSLSRSEIDQLADDIALAAARIDAATHGLLSDIRRFDEANGWAAQNAKSCAAWLSWRIGVGLAAARQRVQVAHALGKLPRIDAAFAKGQLSYSKVRAVCRVATAKNEELLLSYARTSTGAQLEQICSKYRSAMAEAHDAEQRFVRRRPMPDGSVRIELRLRPDEAERVWQALVETRLELDGAKSHDNSVSAETAGTTEPDAGGKTLADAAVVMAEQQLAAIEQGERPRCLAPERRQLLVHLREERLAQDSWSVELADGTRLSGDAFKRLACDAAVVVARTDERGGVLDIGRRKRTVSSALMRALLIRDRHCQWPGCHNHPSGCGVSPRRAASKPTTSSTGPRAVRPR